MVLVFFFLLRQFACDGLIVVRMARIIRIVRMRMNVLMLVGMNQIAVAMFVGVLVGMLMLVSITLFEFIVFHGCFLSSV
jgi:hypothetical protein